MATGLNLTQTYARLLDTKRRVKRGDSEVLKLVRLKPGKAIDGGGYATLKTIASGWNAKRVTRKALGGQFFEVKIADVDGSIRTLLEKGISGQIPTHVQINDRVYEKVGVDDPVVT